MTSDIQTVTKYETASEMVHAAVAAEGDVSLQGPSKDDVLEFIRKADAGLRNTKYAITPNGRRNVDEEWQLVHDVCALAQVVAKDDDVAKVAISHLARRGSEQAYRGITHMLCSSARPPVYRYAVFGERWPHSYGVIEKEVPLDTTYPHLGQFALEAICAAEFRNIHGYVAATQISAECIEPTRRSVKGAFRAAASEENANQAKWSEHLYHKRLMETSLGFLTLVTNKDAMQMMVYAVHNTNYFCSELPLTLPLQVVFERRAMAQVQGINDLRLFNETVSGLIRRIIDSRQLERERKLSGNEWFAPMISSLRDSNIVEEGHITALANYLYQETQKLAAEELVEKHVAAARSARQAVGGFFAELIRK